LVKVLHIRLLGEFSLVYGDQPVTTINTPRLQSLLAYLVLRRGTPQPRYHLAFQFWPDSSEAQARTNLRHLVHLLRQALPHADDFLCVDSAALQWRADAPFTLDLAEFEGAVARAALREVVDVYRGDLLPGCYDDWSAPERERLHQMLVEAVEQLTQQSENSRDYRAAIAYAQRLLRLDPLREETHRRLIRLHALDGDRAAALHAYHNCVTVLQRELAVEPGQATRALYERLLHARPLPQTAGPLAATLPLVGRAPEWSRLLAAWKAAAGGKPQMALLAGEAGIGKTRLAEELLAWANRQGIATASAHCYAAEGALAYAPVVAWLRARPLPQLEPIWLIEIARLLPELLAQQPDLPPPGPLTEAWQRQRLHEALARGVLRGAGAASTPLLLLIEDLHWCDHETLEWLHYLLRFDPHARLLVLGTLRTEEVAADHPLETLRSALRRSRQLAEIEVRPLDQAETTSLGACVMGQSLDLEAAACLYRETEGNPLFIVEMARAALANQLTLDQTCADATALPPTMQAVIGARFAHLSSAARELMGLAATVGRAFTFDVLRQASGEDEEALVRGLDELWQRRIVREQGADAYDFSHDKLRQVAYTGLSAARRRLLHRRVAEALEAVHAGGLDSVSGRVAAHYEQAGEREAAVVWLRRAGEVAYRTGSLVEAVACFKRALELLPQGDKRRAELTCQVGTFSEIPYGKEVAWEWLERAWALAQESDDHKAMALTRFGMSRVMSGRGESEEAQRLAEEALAWAEEINEQGLCASVLSQLGSLARYRGEYDTSLQCLKESIAIFQALGDEYRVAGCLNLMGLVYADKGDYENAARCYQQGLELSRGCHDRLNIARIIQNLGGLAIVQGNYQEAQQYAQEALSCFKEVGDHGGVVVAYNNLGHAAMGLEDTGAAETCYLEALKEAQAIHPSPVALESLAGLAWVSAKRGNAVRAAELLGLATAHPHSNPDVQFVAEFASPLLQEALPGEVLEEALERGKRLDLYQMMVDILNRSPGKTD
jgi:DNA-binding SARP family transcriptional activator